MKTILTSIVLAASLALSGCATFFNGNDATIAQRAFEANAAYAQVLESAVAYAEHCFERTYESGCEDRVAEIQRLELEANQVRENMNQFLEEGNHEAAGLAEVALERIVRQLVALLIEEALDER